MREIKKGNPAIETRPLDETKAAPEELVFYYSREHRLAKAPPEVRALYEKTPPRRFGLFSSLTDTKPKALLFTSIVVMCLMILFMTYMLPGGEKSVLEGNALEISAMRYEGSSFLVIKKKADTKKSFYTGIVDITVYPQTAAVYPQTADGAQAKRQIVFTEEKSEEFRFSVPFESAVLKVFAQGGAGSASFTVPAK
ncbi:MAG: hypothetical protein LBG74_05560 [Spirochaetaceae bacterium]|jgi:hypothetical protein|nr:hypothetical protein [Spirochaetaceae bacterium]